MVIIQACRGAEESKGMRFKSNVQRDSSKMNTDRTSHRYSIPVEADFLVAFSTYEGQLLLMCTFDKINFSVSWLWKK
jgi:hypothetical protein